MAESNATQVILTDDGIKIIKAQSTADNSVGGVANLNDPNLMSVIEKQNNIGQFAGLTSQYNVLVQNAKDDGINTTAVTTAYNNLNRFMADILVDPNHASDVDRVAYKKYQDAYNQELSNLQSALQNNVNNKFTSAASATSQAASTANAAKSSADSAYNYASSEMAVQSMATAKAQSTADSAFSQAVTAINTGQATSQAVTALKDGSTLTIAQLQNGLGDKVSNSEYASYKVQTASQIAQKVDNGAFSAYQSTTADLIASKVATKDFSAYQATTDKSIESKVESSDFKTYKTQTADMIASKVSTVDFNNLTISNRNLALGTATPFKMTGNGSTNNAKLMYTLSMKITKGTTVTASFDITSTSSVGTYAVQFLNSSWQNVCDGLPIVSGTQHLSYTLVTNADFTDGIQLRLDNSTSTVTVSNFIISESSKEVNWTPAPEDQATQSQISQLSSDINLRVKKGDVVSQLNLDAGGALLQTVGDNTKIVLSAPNIIFDTDKPVIIPSANIDSLLVDKTLTAANISANTFSTNNGTFTVDKNGAVVASNLTVRGVTNLVYNAALLGGSGSNIPGWILNGEAYCDNSFSFEGVPAIGWNGDATGRWDNYANSKLQPVTQTGVPYSASIKFRDYGSTSGMLYTFTIGFSSANDIHTRIYNIDYVYTANGSDSGIQTFTINNVIAPSNAKYVDVQIHAYNGKGHAAFSSPMLTQTAQSTGYQPDTGNIVSAGEIDGSTINGSTINGTTFHGGGVISNANNTAKYYPMTITPDGSYKSTYFDSAVGLQSSVESGAINYKYRSMIGNGQYLAYDSVINGQGFESQSGYTSVKDTTFSNTETITGYVNVTPSTGIYLYGPTQKINFAGNADNIGSNGVTMDAYGNIYAQANSAYWRIRDINGNEVANFGIDTANQRDISLYRDTQIGNLFLGVGHTIGMLDRQPLYFKQGDSSGNMLDIKAGAVYYTNLVKSSLLSVKKDVQKADTAYWAQLVNSIDIATYQYKTDDNTSHIRLSSIVDDVNDTKRWQLPDVFISRDENGKLNGVDDSVLLNATLATVQEQQKEIDQLNGHNMELEARLNKLEAKLNG